MRTNLLMWVVALVVIIAGGAWLYSRSTMNVPVDTPTTSPNASPTTVQSPAPTTVSVTKKKPAPTPVRTQTYKSIITQTGSHQCDYEQVGSSGKTSGVVYIADGKMRAELRTSDVVDTRSLAVYDGRYLYIWTEGKTTGTRSEPSSVSQLPIVIPTDLNSGKIFGSGTNSISWNCHSWLKDAKLLVPPSYVTFSAR